MLRTMENGSQSTKLLSPFLEGLLCFRSCQTKTEWSCGVCSRL